MDYAFKTVLLNNREVSVQRVLEGSAEAKDEFESTTLTFIKEWLQRKEEFTLKTSGSTGVAKPIRVTRAQMEASGRATVKALNLKKGASAMVCLDTRFIAGKMMLVRCLEAGMFIQAVTPSANPLEKTNWGKNIQFVAFVPYQLHAILASSYEDRLNNIENVIIGGAPISPELENTLQKYRCRAFMTYGMTETVSHIALRQVNGTERSSDYHTLPGITVNIDERSCLVIDCPYIGDKLITNDIVKWKNETTFEWIGRYDNVINSGGIKVSPEEVEQKIEAVIRSSNLHGRIIISSQANQLLGERIVLVLEENTLESDQKRRIFELLSKALPKYSQPKDIFTLAEFPLTVSGKIDRREIKNLISKRL